MVRMGVSDWQCISCGKVLGVVSGGELRPSGVPSANLITRGPNLSVTCDMCSAEKTWYTADPIVRSVYQLVDALSTEMARKMIFKAGSLSRRDEKTK